jgi:hypothetical protein
MNYLNRVLVGVAMLCGMASAFAQMGNGGATYSGMADSTDKSGDLMRIFSTVTQSTMTAEASMLAAVGQTADADKALAQMKNLTADANVETIEAAIGVQTQTGVSLERSLNDRKVAFDEAGKRQFEGAMLALAKSVQQYAALTKDLPSLKQSLKLAGNKARAPYYASKTIAGSLGEMRQTLKAAALFARANDIPVGDEVDKALTMP